MSIANIFSLQLSSFVAIALLIFSLSCGIYATASKLPDQDKERQFLFKTYDFNQDNHLDQVEFGTFILALFGTDEKRFVTPKTTSKLFELLDLDGDGELNQEEFRKAFQRWLLPIMTTKSCLFLCVPHDATNATDLEQKTTQLIEQLQGLFKVHYVYVSSCHAQLSMEQTAELVEHVQKVLPKAYDIKMYNVDSHLKSIKNKGKKYYLACYCLRHCF